MDIFDCMNDEILKESLIIDNTKQLIEYCSNSILDFGKLALKAEKTGILEDAEYWRHLGDTYLCVIDCLKEHNFEGLKEAKVCPSALSKKYKRFCKLDVISGYSCITCWQKACYGEDYE